MDVDPKNLASSLLDSARQVGAERAVDLVLNVLFVRWMTSIPRNDERGEEEWRALLNVGSDYELVQRFSRLAIFKDDEQPSELELETYNDVLRRLVETVDSRLGDPQDAQSLVGATFDATLEHLGRLGKQAGEADTPASVAELMVALTVRPGDKVLDPAAGNGTCLTTAFNSQPGVSASGFDISSRAARRASMRLMVHGSADKRGSGVWNGDAFEDTPPDDFDVVLAQPPWGATFNTAQKARIEELQDEHPALLRRPVGFPKGDMPWLLLAVHALREGGRAAVLLPAGSATSRCHETHEVLLRLGAIEAIILLPAGVFSHTGIASTLWLLRAPKHDLGRDMAQLSEREAVLMMDARTLGEAQGRGQVAIGGAGRAQIELAVEAFRSDQTVGAVAPHLARLVPVSEIEIRRGLQPQIYLTAPVEESVAHPVPERTMLTEIALENFKSFGVRTTAPLAPLTLIYGANSSGKSSIIQSLLLMQQSKNEERLVTQGANLNVGGFRGILHGHTATSMSLSLSYGVLPEWIPADGTPDPTLPRTITWHFEPSPTGHGALASAEWKFGDLQLTLQRGNEESGFRLDLQDASAAFEGVAEGTLLYPFDARHYTDGDDDDQAKRLRSRIGSAKRALRVLADNGIGHLDLAGSGLLPTGEVRNIQSVGGTGQRDPGIATSYAKRCARLVGGMAHEVEALLDSVVWLGPLRSAPQRVYDRADTTSKPGDGKHVAIYLFDHTSVVEQVNDWLDRLEVPYTLDVVRVSAGNAAANLVGDLVAISLTDRRSGVNVTPADVGFGVSQVLPIVVEMLARRGSVITVEQPETHLHPRLQAKLADLFIDTVQEGGRANQLIVETHSEYLMLRIQRRIREGTLDPAMVSVVYVDQTHDGQATVKPLRLSEHGEFLDDWPDGFFDDRLEELFGEF